MMAAASWCKKSKKQQDLEQAIEPIFPTAKSMHLIEECIIGMELTVGVIGNEKPRALPPSQAVCTSDILSIEEKFLPGAGENQTPAPLPAAALALVQKTMEEVYKASWLQKDMCVSIAFIKRLHKAQPEKNA